jgi:predicted PurR-regulated permease PerM
VEFSRRVAVAVLITILLVGITAFVCWGYHVLLMAFAGVLFAVFLAALSTWLCRYTRLSYGWALAVVVMVLIVLAGGVGWLLENRIAGQIQQMMQELPQSLNRIQDWLSQYQWGEKVAQAGSKAAQSLTTATTTSAVFNLVSGVSNFVIGVIVVIFVGIFGAAEPQLYRSGVLHLIPSAHRHRAGEAIDAVVFNLRWWLVGQVVLMILIGISTGLGLWIIGIPLWFTLGLIAGIMEMIPYAGPWISAVPALLLALLVSPWHVIGVAILYLALHILEGYVFLPLVQRQSVLLPPAFTLVTQVLLGELLGFLGLFVAAPLTVAGVILVKMLYVEDTLHDEHVDVPGEPGNEDKPAAKDRQEGHPV